MLIFRGVKFAWYNCFKKSTSELWMIWPIWPFSMSEMLCQCRRFAGTKGGSCWDDVGSRSTTYSRCESVGWKGQSWKLGCFWEAFTKILKHIWEITWIFSGWWFQIFFSFHPYLGKFSNLTHIFQMGWNHQLVLLLRAGPAWFFFGWGVCWSEVFKGIWVTHHPLMGQYVPFYAPRNWPFQEDFHAPQTHHIW